CYDAFGGLVRATEDALVYHLPLNTIGQRGNSYLLPAIDWFKLNRQFLASRGAVSLAMARFAWKVKVQGGATAVSAAKSVYNEQKPDAGSVAIENMGADLQPIKTDSGASNAYQDGRMIKLMICAATGWPEQYFGDISIGNLATAKTVELPVLKMVQSYQAIWKGCYETIDNLVMGHNNIPEDRMYIDRDFDDIIPEDAEMLANSISALVAAFPQFYNSPDVIQRALLAIGINDTNEVMDALTKSAESDPNVALAKALKQFREDEKRRRVANDS
ncbi:MAG: hypothetical protein KKD77_21785, partial [Gammaproteobacteria bacterium]|nr:hypothetical protein [Gammaproteobacteria bacterium]